MEPTPITLAVPGRTQPGPKLAAKFVALLSAIGPVIKSGRNEHFQYNYAMEADVMQAVREAMVAQRVAMVPRVTAVLDREVRTPRDGNKPDRVTFVTTVFMEFEFIDAESGESCVVSWAGRGEDASDKGIYKAMTGAEKYALLKVLMIPTHDDPEGDEKNDRRSAARAGAPRQAKKMDCPRCSKPMRYDEKAGEFFCWKAKGGCGARVEEHAQAEHAQAAAAMPAEEWAAKPATVAAPVITGAMASEAQKNFVRQLIGRKFPGARTAEDKEQILRTQLGVPGGFDAMSFADGNRLTAELQKRPDAARTGLPASSKLPTRDTPSIRAEYARNVAARAGELMERTGEIVCEVNGEGVLLLVGDAELELLGFSAPCLMSDLSVEQLSRVAAAITEKLGQVA